MKKISIAYGRRSEERGFVANYKLILTVDDFVFKRNILGHYLLHICLAEDKIDLSLKSCIKHFTVFLSAV